MSKDPKPLAKPYLAGEMPYLTQYRVQTWEDGEPSGKDEVPYSELQKPYAYDEDEPEDYSWWENTWPNDDFPIIPPVTWPDPVRTPCAIDDSCTFIKISGSGTMECGDSVPYTAIWVTLGCAMPPGWATFSTWSLSGGDGECELDAGLVIARVKCSSVASPQVLTLTVEGPFGCTDSIQIVVSCGECCEEFNISGDPTVNPGEDWSGTISPACPNAICNVTSNSGCTFLCAVTGNGSGVTVDIGGADCGSFTVTVIDDGEGCSQSSDSITVRINDTGQGGQWDTIDSGGAGCPGPLGGPCFNNCSGWENCPDSPITQGSIRVGSGARCELPAIYKYRGCKDAEGGGCDSGASGDPGSSGCPTAPLSAGTCNSGGHPWPTCDCVHYAWAECEWKCSC